MTSKKQGKKGLVIDFSEGLGSKGPLSWDACSPADLHKFVCDAVRASALVSFARKRDGSAVVLTVLHDDLPDEKYKDYFGTDESIANVVEYMAAFWDGAE